MLQVQRIIGFFYFLLGLFMVTFIGGKLLLQLLGIICGAVLCFRGFRLMRPVQRQESFRTFFNQDNFF
jgi:hypothetical protein